MSDVTSVIEIRKPGRQLHLRRMRVAVVRGPDTGQEAEFESDVVHIGTAEGNDFRLTDDTVSRRHAVLDRTHRGTLLRDLDSTNGSFIGDVRVREGYLERARTFRVGQTELSFTPNDQVVDIVPAAVERFGDIVGRSVAMREVFSVLDRVSPTELTVLVTGETGTGKELVSRAVHERSRRARGPLVVFDCGAVARNLVESELFGHERGAFTGAVAPRPGVFEQADGGTLFLDELGELPLELQPTLLRVLEQREVRRLGDRRTRPVDVRIVAATNRDLEAEVAAGRFRQDLYYRLAVVEVALPALRERVEDIPLLVEHLLGTANFPHGVQGITDAAAEVLSRWTWPGNVRELRNVLSRCLPFVDGEVIDVPDLPAAMQHDDVGLAPLGGGDLPLEEARDDFERRYLEQLLDRAEGSRREAARLAGVDRRTLTRMLKRHGLA